MNISRFTPPVSWGKGLQDIKDEVSRRSHQVVFRRSMAVAMCPQRVMIGG